MGLGLDMKKYLLLALLLTLQLSCVKKDELKDDMGPEVSWDSIKAEAYKPLDVKRVQLYKGEWAGYARVQRLAMNPNGVVAEKWTREVVDRVDNGSEYEITVLHTSIRKTERGEESFRIQEAPVYLDKTSATTQSLSVRSMDMQERVKVMVENYHEQVLNQKVSIQSSNMKYYNLKVVHVTRPLPDAVKQLTGCGGYADCNAQIRVTQVDFDQIDTSSGYNRYHMKFEVSPDVPYLSYWLNQCITLLYQTTDMKVPVEQCNPALVYSFGKL